MSIKYNNIENYTHRTISLEGTSAGVDVTNNWWGTNDTHAINMTIYDFKFDFNLGKVTLSPIIDSPNTIRIHSRIFIMAHYPNSISNNASGNWL